MFDPNRHRGILAVLVCVGVLGTTAQRLPAQVVINELMFHPPHALPVPEDRGQEWIELHNTDPAAAVDLSGWRFTDGVDFTFPGGMAIPAGGYLIVSADPAAFTAAHPGVTAAVVGGWTGSLSNDGERLVLENLLGAEVENFRYSDEGEWSRKVRDVAGRGWSWDEATGGGGHSVERRGAHARADTGQNWAASGSPGGTPGAVNSVAVTDLPPFIEDVRHHPAVPRGGEPVIVTARVDDDWNLPTEVWVEASEFDDSEPELVEILSEAAPKTAHVPADGGLGLTWTEPDFDDAGWTAFEGGGVGYDSRDYLPYIAYDTRRAMRHVNTTIYTRAEFDIEDLNLIGSLFFNVRADDGFVVYLNGVLVASNLAPVPLPWNASATGNGDESIAVQLTPYNLDAHVGLLLPGRNVLAVHGLNSSLSSSDFLISYTLDAVLREPEPELIMHDDGQHGDGAAGDGVYGATVDGAEAGTVRGFRVVASDGGAAGERRWPEHAQALYQHDDEQPSDGAPLYRVVMTPDDYQAHLSLNRQSDALIDATFIAGDKIRYRSGVRFRGNSSRTWNPPPIRIDLPHDDTLGGASKLNLNTIVPEIQTLGMRAIEAAGLPTPATTLVGVRFNGENRMRGGGPYVHIEPLGDSFVDRVFPREERGGNMYKAQGSHSNNWIYRGDDPLDYQQNGWEKRNNTSANDWTDLIDFHEKVNINPLDPDLAPTIEALWDVDQWLRSFAANVVMYNREGGLPTGSDDDYSIYKRPTDGRWVLLPHDFDSLFGYSQGSLRFDATSDNVFGMLRRARDMFVQPAFRDRYLDHIIDLLDTTYSAENFDPLVDTLLPEDQREARKTWMAQRRVALRQMIQGAPTIERFEDTEDGLVVVGGTVPYRATSLTVNGMEVANSLLSRSWNVEFPPSQQTSVVPRGASWKYLDDGSDAGTAWRMPGFDDAAWAAGAAPLGYGADDIATVIDDGGVFGFGRHITTYLRHQFVVADPSAFASGELTVQRDDGVAIYLNGVELARDNLDLMADYLTPAGSEVEAAYETADITFIVPASLLVAGDNVLAVELHASDPDFNPDVRFEADLKLNVLDFGPLALRPGDNSYIVQAFDSNGVELGRAGVEINVPAPATTVLGSLAADTTLTRTGGPYLVDGDLVVPQGVTLTIEPGAALFFTKDASLIVEGTLVAEGSPAQPIRFAPDPFADLEDDIRPGLSQALPKWDGIHFFDSPNPNNVIAHAIVDGAQDSGGSIGATDSVLRVEEVEFRGSHLRYVHTARSSILIDSCVFPDMFAEGESPFLLGLDNISEHIKGVGGIPTGGRYIIRGNAFGTNKGHNDVIDVDSGRRPDPILQIIGNTFAGAGDECLDLGGDVYVVGNVFQNVAKDPDNTDRGYANAISTGDGATGSTVLVARNIFLNVDHAINLKRGDRTVFENNTVVGINPDFTDAGGNPVVASVINLYVDEPFASPGSGAYAGDNIIAGAPRLFGNADLPAGTTSDLAAWRNLLPPGLPDSVPGEGNVYAAPQFVDADGGDYTALPGATLAGAMGPEGIVITGEPPTTPADTATLSIGGPGLVAFRYRLDGGAWSGSIEIPLTAPRRATLELVGLAPGAHFIEAYGQDFAGNWQDESQATLSATWTVDPLAVGVVLTEVGPGWAELQNRTAADIDIAGTFLTSALADAAPFPAGTIVPAGSAVTFPLPVELLRGDSVAFDNQPALVFNSIPAGFTLALDGAAGWVLGIPTPDAPNRVQPLASPRGVRLNEWFASPEVVLGADFVELFNPSGLPVDLAGLAISDGTNTTAIPLRTYLAPGGFYTAVDGGEFHQIEGVTGELGFGLDGGFEVVQLKIGDGETIAHAATIAAMDEAAGRLPGGEGAVGVQALPTPGFTNAAPVVLTKIGEEVLVDTGHVWRYLDNGAVPPADWASVGFDDWAWASGPSQLGFGDNDEATPIDKGDPAGSAYFFRSTFDVPNEPGIHTYSFAVVRDDGAVIYVDGAEIGRSNMPDPAEVPVVDQTTPPSGSVGAFEEDTFVALDSPLPIWLSPGQHALAASVHQNVNSTADVSFDLRILRETFTGPDNDPLATRSLPVFDHLRITEVHYHPSANDDLEFIELQNYCTNRTLDLEGVRLTDAVRFTFPAMSLAPGEFVLVAQNSAALTARFGASLPIAGEFEGRLANGDETVSLSLPAPLAARVLNFQYQDHWYLSTDGGGDSLNIIDSVGDRASWREARAWQAAAPSPGTAHVSVPAGFADWALVRGITDPADDRNGDGVPHLLEYALGLEPDGPPAAPLQIDGAALLFSLPATPRADLFLTLEQSNDGAAWIPIAFKSGDNAGWTGAATVTETPAGDLLDIAAALPPVGTEPSLYRLRAAGL